MEVQLFNPNNQKFYSAVIERAKSTDMPLKKTGWQFNWKTLFKVEGSEIFKLTLLKSPLTIEGLIMLSLMNQEMLYLNNIEIASHNLGENGTYDRAAGCLIAYGCQQSFEKGKGDYRGYLTFESKSQLIGLYEKKYGATKAMGLRMFIDPEAGLKLIKEYLETHEENK